LRTPEVAVELSVLFFLRKNRYKLEEDRRAERHRRHSIIAGGKKVVINWLEWNLPLQETH